MVHALSDSGRTNIHQPLKDKTMTLVKVNNRPYGNLLDGFINEFPSVARSFGQDFFQFPETNIHETPDAYHLELNVPGRAKEDFKIQVDQDLLTISFEKKEEKPASDDYKTIRREFTYKSFKRSFTIDNGVDVSGIQAKYENGLLKLLLPKKEEVKQGARQISID
jgi:HSP20 family protein